MITRQCYLNLFLLIFVVDCFKVLLRLANDLFLLPFTWFYREINIYDCSPDLFRHFLCYLYSGRLDCASITTEALADLIAISDQYEVSVLFYFSVRIAMHLSEIFSDSAFLAEVFGSLI